MKTRLGLFDRNQDILNVMWGSFLSHPLDAKEDTHLQSRIRIALQAGADPNFHGILGWTPLMLAIDIATANLVPEAIDLVFLLLNDSRVDVNAADMFGATAFDRFLQSIKITAPRYWLESKKQRNENEMRENNADSKEQPETMLDRSDVFFKRLGECFLAKKACVTSIRSKEIFSEFFSEHKSVIYQPSNITPERAKELNQFIVDAHKEQNLTTPPEYLLPSQSVISSTLAI